MLKLSTSLCIAAVSAIKTANFEEVWVKQGAETKSQTTDAPENFSPQEVNSVSIGTLRNNPKMISEKMGLITRKDMTQNHLDAMSGYISWTYNYTLLAETYAIDWMNENGVEFVPMIYGTSLNKDQENEYCDIGQKDPTHPDYCGKEALQRTIQDTQDLLTTPMTKLMGFNEPYNHAMDPADGVEYWRKIIQPVAQATNLELVSTTMQRGQDASRWQADFLYQCWKYRDDEEYPCTVQEIKHFSVHLYTCDPQTWKEYYEPNEGAIFKKYAAMLDQRMGADKGKMDWKEFLDSRNIMVTETNCNRDTRLDLFSTPEVQCEKITGQFNREDGKKTVAGRYFGDGSIAELMKMDNISHFAWWNAYNAGTKNLYRVTCQSMMDVDGNLTATGRALTNGLDAENSECNVDTSYVDLGEGRMVLENEVGAYFDICTKEYLGHVTPRPGVSKDKEFDIQSVEANQVC